MSLNFNRRSIALVAIFLILSPVLPVPSHASRTTASVLVRPDADKILKARELADRGKVDDAKKLLEKAIQGEKSKERRSLLRLALGMIFIRAQRDAEAEAQLKLALEDGVRIPDYVHYQLGLLRTRLGRLDDARADFEKVISFKETPRVTANDARLEIAKLSVAKEQWELARTQLEKLRRPMRGDVRFPEVLYLLTRANGKTGNKIQFCRYARELYSKYPAYSEIQNWGPKLEQNLIDGKKVGCSATNKDLRTRVRRLWLAGEKDRAAEELKFLKDEAGDEGESSVDGLIVNHLISEGRSGEALKILMRSYEQNRNRPAYLQFLAKAASAAGEYQMSVAAYQRAYELAPRSKDGINALFLSAFTSYQMQDYDGASRKFEQLVRLHPRSRNARDSQWYLAWIRYLRGDYLGAIERFKELSRQKPRRGRRRRVQVSDLVQTDRIQYWTAMSHLKMGKSELAIPIFQKLARDPSLGYYSMLAYHRLRAIPDAKVPEEVETRLGLRRVEGAPPAPSEEELKAAAEASAEDAAAEYAEALSDQVSDTDSESENEESEEKVETPQIADVSTTEVPPNFKDPRLAKKFERARDLAIIGLEDAARRELREIEKRARSAADRKLLMTEYAALNNYERSSFIADVGFGTTRLRTGLVGEGRQYWEHAFPRAWDSAVRQASRSTGVPEELIWSIMRAESHFRFDAQSPVGALGLMQVMPFTGRQVADLMNLKEFEVRSLLVPETNIRLGARYLQRLMEKFNRKIPLVAAGYNAGPHRVYAWIRNFGTLDMDEFIEHIPFVETRNYVKRVARNYQIYGLLYRGSAQLESLIQPVGIRFEETFPIHEIW